MLLTAPDWARVGLTVRDERLRKRAAECLAVTIVQALDEQPVIEASDDIVALSGRARAAP